MTANRELVKIGEAARIRGVTPSALRRWHSSGELIPARVGAGGIRYYEKEQLLDGADDAAATVGYARVFGRRRQAELDRQRTTIERYCRARRWRVEVVSDQGRGPALRQPGLYRVIDLILRQRLRRLIVTHKERLTHAGAEIIFLLCELKNVEVIILNQGLRPELAPDPDANGVTNEQIAQITALLRST